ncbi:hypothetical protein [Marinobacter manganoxydans]|uniref:hypothetical protein n=1 Tax=Marinobacter manganoxydans TaxID=1150997 RepID=UPI001303EF7B|nr:hypothetical protein [Marinobacter manganoxydans]MDX1553684.1 hypothetical protein [Marinobacter sp.]
MMNLKGINPADILAATVQGTVLESKDHQDLVGSDLEFAFANIEWNSEGCLDGGVAVMLPGNSYMVVKISSLKFV